MFPKGFNLSKQKTILLVDMDVVSFRSAAASESRSVEVIHKPSDRSRIFTTRTAFKDYLKAKSFEFKEEDYEFVDIQTEEDISHPLHSMKVQIKKMKEFIKPDEIRLLIGGSSNFRNQLPLLNKYKSNRKDSLRPVHLDECREFAIRNLGAEVVEGCECDDALFYIGNKYLQKGYKVVVATNDKDSHSHEGFWIYNFTKEGEEPWLVPELGELWVGDDKKIKGKGFLWFAFQWGYGDRVDGLIPMKIAGIKGFGEMAMYSLLKDCKTKQEAFNAVVNKYNEWYKDCPEYTDWKGEKHIASPQFMLQTFFKGVRMMSTPDDDLDLIEFCKKEGLVW